MKKCEYFSFVQCLFYIHFKRQYYDYVYMQTLKGGGKYAIKYMFFTGTIIGTSVLIQAYRNKSSLFDYALGGLVSGSLLRMHHGIHSLIMGASVGMLFGYVIPNAFEKYLALNWLKIFKKFKAQFSVQCGIHN